MIAGIRSHAGGARCGPSPRIPRLDGCSRANISPPAIRGSLPIIVTRGVRERERRGTPLRRLSWRRSDQRLARHEVPAVVAIPGVRNGILIRQPESECWTRRARRRQEGAPHGSPGCLKVFPTTSSLQQDDLHLRRGPICPQRSKVEARVQAVSELATTVPGHFVPS